MNEEDSVNQIQIAPSIKEKKIIHFISLKVRMPVTEIYCVKSEKTSHKLGVDTCNIYEQCRINMKIHMHQTHPYSYIL